MLLALWVAPRCPPGWLARRHARVWEPHSRHCVVYAADNADEEWPETIARPQRAIRHVHRSRSDRCGSLLAYADLAGGTPIALCPPLHMLAGLPPLCSLPDPPLTPSR